MANPLNFKCPECGQDIQLEEEPGRSSVICPKCAKDVAVPAQKGKNIGGMIAAVSGVVVVLLAIIFIFIFVKVQAQRAEERRIEAKRQSEAAARMQEVKRIQAEEAEKKRWLELTNVVDRSKLKTESDYFRAVSAIDQYAGGDPDEKDKLKAQLNEFKAEDVKALMVRLDAEAKMFGDKNEFIKAIAIYQDYRGDFKADSEEARKQGAQLYFNKADEAAAAKRLAEEKIQKDKDACLNELAAGLVEGKITESLAKFEASPYKKDLPEIAAMVENMSKLNDIVINSFNLDIEKKITVALKEGKTPLLIKKVDDGKIHTEYKKANVAMIKKYGIKDLDDSEIISRLSAFDKPTGALVAGIKAVRKRKYDEAEANFQNTGGNFSIPLMAKLAEFKESHQQTEAKEEKPAETEKKDPGPIIAKKIKVSVKVTKAGKKNLDMGEVAETINVRYSVTNGTGQDINGYNLTILLIGESLIDKKLLKVIKDFPMALNLKDKETKQEKLTFINQYNSGGEIGGTRGAVGVVGNNNPRLIPKSGYEYYSWLYILQDPSGKVEFAESKHSKLESNAADILKNIGSDFNDSGTKINMAPPGGGVVPRR